jgi:hypothetical protein
MPKKTKRQQNVKNSKLIFSRYKYALMIFGGIAIIVGLAAYFGIRSLIPVNGNAPTLAPPINTFLKANYSPQTGFLFTSSSTNSRTNATFNSPTIFLKYGELASIHLINEDETRSLHNLNIDAFNVHTRNLGYFESQSSTFIANKIGTFVYYCSIHPEMRGLIRVEQ